MTLFKKNKKYEFVEFGSEPYFSGSTVLYIKHWSDYTEKLIDPEAKVVHLFRYGHTAYMVLEDKVYVCGIPSNIIKRYKL